MKKTVAVVVVSLCCWFLADLASSKCIPGQPKTAEIGIVVSGNSFSYKEKGDDPVPCIFRKTAIEVSVEFVGDENEFIEMKDFYAQAFFNTGNGWTKDDEENLAQPLKMTIDGTADQTAVKFVNDQEGKPAKHTIEFQTNKQSGPAHGPNRLITFTLVIADKKGNNLMTFDPPWGERP